jgi:hypothetical protein
MTDLESHFDEGGYLIVNEQDHSREVGAYKQVRYSDRAFRSLKAQVGVNQVVSNNAIQLYHVPRTDL